MQKSFDAIYESGVLRPLEPLPLDEHQIVSLAIQPITPETTRSNADDDWIDHDAHRMAEQEGDESVTLEEVRERLKKIPGSLSDVVIAERGEY